MKQKIGNSVLVLMFFSLMVILSVPLFALEEQGNLDHFSEADAIRYGGLFGPLVDPYEGDLFRGIDNDPTNPFRPLSPLGTPGISTRDMGFNSGEDHYTPITPAPRTTSSS